MIGSQVLASKDAKGLNPAADWFPEPLIMLVAQCQSVESVHWTEQWTPLEPSSHTVLTNSVTISQVEPAAHPT